MNTLNHRLLNSFVLCVLVLFLITISLTKSTRAATFIVTKTADTSDGVCNTDCSFREALSLSLANTEADVINFNIPISDGGYINPDGSRNTPSNPIGTYPATPNGYFTLTPGAVVIASDIYGILVDGYSQPNSARNTNSYGDVFNANILIQMSASFTFTNSLNSHITGLNLYSSGSPIMLIGGSNHWIEGNILGGKIDTSGTLGYGAIVFDAVGGTSNSVVGVNGDGIGDIGERNVITGNGQGWYSLVSLSGTGNKVSGNYIGTNKTGRACTPGVTMPYMAFYVGAATNGLVGSNYDGVSDSEESNTIGCPTEQFRAFIRILATSSGIKVQGNYIGVSPQGDTLGSLIGTGRAALSMAWGSAQDNIIYKNTLANADYGYYCYWSTCNHNTISQNSIFNNALGGIQLGGGLANDPGDLDDGENNLMNTPLLTKATLSGDGRLFVSLNLDFNPTEGPYTIEFFDNDSMPELGKEQGKYYVGSVTANSVGSNESFSISLSNYVPDDITKITATATNALGSTSEFSPVTTDSGVYSSLVNGTLVINDGEAFSESRIVQLNTTTVGEFFEVTSMKASERGDFSGASWETYNTTTAFTTSTDGNVTIFVKFKDSQGNESATYSDGIVVDSTAPTGNITIGTNDLTNNYSVDLQLSASDITTSVTEMLLSEDADFTNAVWEPFATNKTFILTGQDGTKQVFVKYKDAEGNESIAYSDHITLDTLKPTVEITDLGLIPNIPNRANLFYYFTSQTPQVKGLSETGNSIYFKSLFNSHVYSTTSTNEGKFSILLKNPELPRNTVELQYYAIDPAGNKSSNRTLSLLIGEENFPILVDKDEEEDVVEATPTPISTPTVSESSTIEPSATVTVTTTINQEIYTAFVAEREGKRYVSEFHMRFLDGKGRPLSNLQVTLHSEAQTVRTNVLGIAIFKNVEIASHTVTFERNGVHVENSVEVKAATLGERVVELETMTVVIKESTNIWLLSVVVIFLAIAVGYILIIKRKSK